eukprot:UN02422
MNSTRKVNFKATFLVCMHFQYVKFFSRNTMFNYIII